MVQKGRSKTLAIADITSELAELTESLNKRLQEAYLDTSTGRDHRRTHRGSSHRTSFIEYVSEVYNARKEVRKRERNSSDGSICFRSRNDELEMKLMLSVPPVQVSSGGSGGMAGAAASSFIDRLSVRGQSISSNGSGESKVSLSRDLSVRSENVVGAGGHHGAVAAQSARIMTATRSNTTRTKSKGETRLFVSYSFTLYYM